MSDNVIDDGGPAFPCIAANRGRPQGVDLEGMTKRDWFAGQAIAGIIMGADIAFLMGKREGRITTPEAARDAFRVADAMIVEQRKGVSQ